MNFAQKKDRLLKQLADITASGGDIGLQKDTSNLFRHRDTSQTKKIDVRQFNQVIKVDLQAMEAEVEGMTTYEALVDETLKHGVMPTVVPELKTITIGGALTGVGIESSSFKFGLVHETITEIEVLLGHGEIIIARPDNEYKDLFYAFPNSYGTFGYALRLKVKLVPVKPFVKLEHTLYTDAHMYFLDLNDEVAKARARASYDFIDGTIFAKDSLYLTKAKFVDDAPNVSDYTGKHMYYASIKERAEDYVTVKDYIWRWDTDWFWCSKHFGVQNPVLRACVPKKYLRSATYWKIRAWASKSTLMKGLRRFEKKYKESVIQDVEIPVTQAVEFIDFFHKEIGIKPIWVCPTMAYDPSVKFDLYPMDQDTLYINFGFWDVVSSKIHHEPGYFNRLIEKNVRRLHGKKSLYSDSYYTRDEFWQLYDQDYYTSLKKKYDPKARLKGLYEKCVKNKA